MKISILLLALALPLSALAHSDPFLSAEKCETYEEDCERQGNEEDEPTRPGDPDSPDDPGTDGL